MKHLLKRTLPVLLAVSLCVCLLSSLTFSASAASYIYNWGERGELATSLSDNAVKFYDDNGVTYDELTSYSGSSTISSVPGSALYKQLQTLMKSNHSYINNYAATKTMFAYTDCQNGGGSISSFYSGKSIGPSWNGSWNREHTWPNSKGKGGSDENDIMMLRPTATSENSSRGNAAYGQSSGYYNPNDESDGKYDLRGDVARIVLYQYVRWGVTNTGSKYNSNDIFGTKGVIESKAVMLEWMEEDPVDTWELGRNDSVESITGTRNVFVDYPELAFLLFGEDIPAGYDSPSGEGAANPTTTTKGEVTTTTTSKANGGVTTTTTATTVAVKTTTTTAKNGQATTTTTTRKGGSTVTTTAVADGSGDSQQDQQEPDNGNDETEQTVMSPCDSGTTTGSTATSAKPDELPVVWIAVAAAVVVVIAGVAIWYFVFYRRKRKKEQE